MVNVPVDPGDILRYWGVAVRTARIDIGRSHLQTLDCSTGLAVPSEHIQMHLSLFG